ncbi:FdhF/YdeP family oxidoreductase [Urbifossiella limnaea]|uniref:Formate dehydrogenase H n=1 Tax=Urbifossiella limnaea TaxID=2528023 RepID=A0A517XT09_9BACT|nr:FdhF/YdeP family oxidoreductase [Urbifossiella limnaea]QDU20627.1 Formate dehydrogenase H [Urbifossiella limnaea]
MSDPSQPNPPPYPSPAAGLGALVSSLKHVVQNRGVVRNLRSLLRVNQPDGFDCPGCAWPEPKDPSRVGEYCENGVKAVTFETTAKRVTPEFFARHTVGWLRGQTHHWLENQGRLTHPMRYNPATDHYEPVTWADAFALVGGTLRGLDSPDRALFYTSGRTSNEAAFLYQLLARRFGTNNLPDCSNMCHESSGTALGEQLGVGKGTVTLEDFDHADLILVIGQNPGTNHPRMLAELQKAAERGAKIMTLNPLREPGLVSFVHPKHPVRTLLNRGTSLSTHYYQVLVGGDLAALTGICAHLLYAEAADPGKVIDHDFIRHHTDGFEAFAAQVNAADWPTIERESGLTRDQLREAAEVYRQGKKVIACWAMGLTQHKHAVATIQMVVNLLLMRGNVGREGAGVCPVRGHSNVQGDRTMGINEKPPAVFLDGLQRAFGFDPPRGHGHDTVGAINAMADGSATVFIGMGGNFAAATPDTEFTEEALRKCALTVHVSTKLNRSHLCPGKDALILPCLGRSERDVQATGPQRVTVEDSMSMVHASAGSNPPASEHLLSEVAVVCGIAEATFPDGAGIDWAGFRADYRRVREKITATLPQLFDGYEEKLQTPGGFYLGNAARERRWNTATGKARFMPHPVHPMALPAGQLRLMTIRSHDQFNTTVYDLHDRYRGVHGTRMVVFIHPADLAERGLKDGDAIDLHSHTIEDGLTRTARGFRAVAYDIPRGCAAAYFPETNGLVSKDSFAHRSRTPLSKFIPITIVAGA